MANSGPEITRAYVAIIPSMEGAQGEISKQLVPAAESAGEEAGKSSGNKMSTSIGSVLKASGKAIVAGITAAASAAAAAIGTVVSQAKELAAAGDNIDKASQKLGFSAEAYQEWDQVLQHSGSSIESASGSIKKLSMAAVNGSEAFDALGISQEQIAAMDNGQLFAKTIQGLQSIEDENERAALASELFGRSYMELGPLLNTSAEDTQAMIDRAHELGIVMGDDLVKESAAFQDNLQDMQAGLTGLKRGIISQALPSLNKLMVGFTGVITGEEGATKALAEGVKDFIKSIGNMVKQAGTVAKDILPAIIDALVEGLPDIVDLGVGIIQSLINGILNALPKILAMLPTLVTQILNLIFQVVAAIVEALPTLIPQLIDAVVGIILAIFEAIPQFIDTVLLPLIDALPDIIMAIVNAVMENLPILIQGILTLVLAIVDRLPEIMTTLFDAIVELIPELFTTILSNLPTIIVGILSVIVAIVEKLPELLTKIWESITKFFTDVWEQWIKPAASAVGEFFSGLWEDIVAIFSVVADWFDTNVIQPVVEFFKGLWESVSGFFSSLWEDIKGVWNTVSSWFDTNIIQPLTNFFTGLWEGVKTAASGAWEGVKSAFSGAGSWISENVTGPIGNFFSTAWEGIKSGASSLWEGVKSVFQGAIDFLKNLFLGTNFEWPKIKMPHFSITGSFNLLTWPPQVPRLTVDWYAKAMQHGMILDDPTLFGMMDGNLLGAGEAGSEAVVGTQSLREMIYGATMSAAKTIMDTQVGTNNQSSSIVVNVYGAEGQDVSSLADEVLERLQSVYEQKEVVYA